MKALASFVLPGESVADIGTDHGFVPIDLLAQNIVPFAILTDINAGPLEKAKNNLDRICILPQFYELRKGDGLEPLSNGEVSSVIIAGMGGETIVDILSWDITKSKSYKRLILQPRKRSWELREWLYNNDFTIEFEKLVLEDSKICEIIVAKPGKDKMEKPDFYLPKLMRSDPLFPEFLNEYIRKINVVIDNMSNSSETNDLVKSWQLRLEEAERIKNEHSSN